MFTSERDSVLRRGTGRGGEVVGMKSEVLFLALKTRAGLNGAKGSLGWPAPRSQSRTCRPHLSGPWRQLPTSL